VVAGEAAAVLALQEALEAEGVRCRTLSTSHAFHSPMMEPVLDEFAALLRTVPLRPPQIPFVSNVTGAWITAEQATDPHYWARHLRQTVRFADGLQTLLAEGERALVEVGPGQTLVRLAQRHPDAPPGLVALASLHLPGQPSEHAALLTALGRLWQAGVPVEWGALHTGARRRRVPLPTYPFERRRFWVEPGERPAPDAQPRAAEEPGGLSRWFYQPTWARAPLRPQPWTAGARTWLLLLDPCGLGAALAERLAAEGQIVVLVQPGPQFGHTASGVYTVRPQVAADYRALAEALRQRRLLPDAAVHLWGVTAEPPPGERLDDLLAAQERGLVSLVYLAQALGAEPQPAPCALWVVANQLQDVSGAEPLAPAKAPLLGACRVLPQEYPELACRSVDVVLPERGPLAPLVGQLLAEFAGADSAAAVAYRGPHRWVQSAAPLALDDTPAAPLREGGVYLITGGLEDIGYVLAESIAQAVPARLALVEPPGFPAPEAWAAWLETHPAGDPVGERIRRARALEDLRAELLVLSADLGDPDAVRAAVGRTVARFGRLDGVVHAARAERARRIKAAGQLEGADLEAHLRPQAGGLLALAGALAERQLDFFALAASLASLLGGVGMLPYAAASAFLDAYAQLSGRGGAPWRVLSINWDHWSGAGESTWPGQAGIGREEGAAAFLRILAASPCAQVAVSTGDLAARQARPQRAQPRPPAEQRGAQLHPRPALGSVYMPPASDLERTLVELWQQALGIAPIGVQDNFFDLGGDSLVALQISARLKQALGIDIPVVSLYEGLTVQALALLLQPEQPAQAPAPGEQGARQQRLRQLNDKQRSRRRTSLAAEFDDL
jgi:acyl transferase domain-containing protein/acyl carrier protein